jgi:hypothetical protein
LPFGRNLALRVKFTLGRKLVARVKFTLWSHARQRFVTRVKFTLIEKGKVYPFSELLGFYLTWSVKFTPVEGKVYPRREG